MTSVPDRPVAGGPIDPGPRPALERPNRRVASAPRVVEKTAVLAYRLAEWLVARLPTGPTARVVGWFVQGSYLLWPTKRRWSNRNFGHVLGLPPDDPAVRRMALRAYRSYARYLVELLQLPSLSQERAIGLIDQAAVDDVERLWRGSNGLIFAACHVGNNEIIAAAIGWRGWPLAGLADDSTFPELFEHLRAERARWNARVIPWRNLREVYAVLRRREMLALLVDWGYRADDVPVRLFGAWTTLPAGPATLAGKTGALIVPVAIRRLPDGRFHASTEPPIQVASTEPAEVLRATQAIADAIEGVIAAAPEQWYSFKPIWPETAAEAAELERRAARMAAG